MINITIGCECGDRLNCDMAAKCKRYKPSYRLHNLSVDIHRFFEYKLHIKLPYLLYINKKYVRLSGTSKCPHKKERIYTCYDCKHISGEYLRECDIPYDERKKSDDNIHYIRCGSFEKCNWADDYLKNEEL